MLETRHLLENADLARPPAGHPAQSPCADPASASAVTRGLRGYLSERLGGGEICFAEEPEEIPHGWETYIYRFRLRPADSLPRQFDRPLIVRIYASAQGVPRAQHEYTCQKSLDEAGFPVPEPLLLGEDCGVFGGPFLVMKCLPGGTLLDYLRHHNMRILWVAAQLADWHAQLHAQPVGNFPMRPGPFLKRRLNDLTEQTRSYHLTRLTAALDYLRAHPPAEPTAPCILHLDFHPINLMVDEGRPVGVLDWSEADVGDHHADVATTVMLIYTSPVEGTNLREHLLTPAVRWFLIRHDLRVYASRLGLDLRTLRYYLAWATLRRLAVYGMWLRAGPQSTGCKPSSLRHLTTGHVKNLQECCRHWTGVEARVV
jgi:aminoglycoside phosphotransferase (APT) family kinase protein